MAKKNVIEKGVLAHKIKEHFTKNPKACSVIIKTKMDGGKKFWRVTKEGKDFKIVEIKTTKEEFVLEMEIPKPTQLTDLAKQCREIVLNAKKTLGPELAGHSMLDLVADQIPDASLSDLKSALVVAGVGYNPYKEKSSYLSNESLSRKKKNLKEASSQFASISKTFSDAIVTMDHTKLSTALQQVQPLVGQLTDPVEKQQAGAIVGTLTTAVNSTTKAGSTVQVPVARPTQQHLTTGKSVKGKVVKEEGEEPSKKKDSTIEPEEPDDEVGIESSSDDQESAPEADATLGPTKSEEETLFLETLKGQTIQAADLQLDTNGGVLTLQFISVEAPLEFEWKTNGKVLYRHKGRPYIIKK